MIFKPFKTAVNFYRNFLEALSEFKPNILIYNAGTDILAGDRLGGLSVSEQVLVKIQHSKCIHKVDKYLLFTGNYFERWIYIPSSDFKKTTNCNAH